MSVLLPKNFDGLVTSAVQGFWTGRTSVAVASQAGGRGSVIGGKNMDGFATLINAVSQHCGCADDCTIISGKRRLTLPGFFRPTKMWDCVVLYKGRLVAAFELKSHVGPSFSNNFNNRAEESLGSATDLWTAYREKAFDLTNYRASGDYSKGGDHISQPFLGYLMLLEECEESTRAVRVEEEHFSIFPEFRDSSYARRYQLLCEKMVTEKLYSAAGLLLSNRVDGATSGKHDSPTDDLSVRSLFAAYASRLLFALETF